MMHESDVKEYLMRNDQEFCQLAQEHQIYEDQLNELHCKTFFNVQDEFQERVIKKKKLAIKDQMQIRIHTFQEKSSV